MNVTRYCLAFALCAVLFPVPAAVAGQALTVSVERRKETITLEARKTSPYKVFLLPSPHRLVVDIPSVVPHPSYVLPRSYHGRLIAKVRSGQFDPRTWRIVFELNQPVKVLDDDEGNGEITIELAASGDAAPAKSSHPSKASADPGDQQQWPSDDRKNISREAYKPDEGRTEKKHETKPAGSSARHEDKAVKADRHDRSDLHTSRASRPVVVIDPGHGGVDPGTEGPDGTYEKDVVLQYARELRERLEKTGRYTVVLTRNRDDIIMLRKRVDIARKAGASIFISLHADSAPEDVRGLSVYTVSEKASDQEAEALAARENKADVLTGINLADEREDVAGILISLAERETKNRSATLADELVTALDDKVQLLSNTHRFAGFAVLKAPDVPSVLVEIGFLSHPKEEKLINSKAYRDKVTGGIVEGINRYFALEKRMGDL